MEYPGPNFDADEDVQIMVVPILGFTEDLWAVLQWDLHLILQ
jgi:hypothetical protein